MLVIRGLSKSFRTSNGVLRPVLQDFNGKLEGGRLVILCGANGSGKSVFSRILVGDLQPDSGEIRIGTVRYMGLNPATARAAGVRYVPQRLPRFKEISGFDLLGLEWGRRSILFSANAVQRKAESVLEKLSFSHELMLGRTLDRFSSDELQRLFLVKAFWSSPRIVILDEPGANLESGDFQKLVRRLELLAKKDNLLVVVIAHPDQLHGLELQPLWFSSSGFAPRPVHNAANIPPIQEGTSESEEERLAEIKLANRQRVNVSKGRIICIRGDSSSAFNQLPRALFHADERYISISPGAKREEWKLIPFDGQESMLGWKLTVLDNVLINNWRRGPWCRFSFLVDRNLAKEKLLSWVVDLLGVEPADAGYRLNDLSGGNRQRLLIARVCYSKPLLLIAGNLFRGQDEIGVERISRFLRRGCVSGRSVILLRNGSGAEEKLADETLYFSNGSLDRVDAD